MHEACVRRTRSEYDDNSVFLLLENKIRTFVALLALLAAASFRGTLHQASHFARREFDGKEIKVEI